MRVLRMAAAALLGIAGGSAATACFLMGNYVDGWVVDDEVARTLWVVLSCVGGVTAVGLMALFDRRARRPW